MASSLGVDPVLTIPAVETHNNNNNNNNSVEQQTVQHTTQTPSNQRDDSFLKNFAHVPLRPRRFGRGVAQNATAATTSATQHTRAAPAPSNTFNNTTTSFAVNYINEDGVSIDDAYIADDSISMRDGFQASEFDRVSASASSSQANVCIRCLFFCLRICF